MGNGGKRGTVKSRNMYEGPMDKDKGKRVNVGGRGGQGRIIGGK